jgi:hypothetical protein
LTGARQVGYDPAANGFRRGKDADVESSSHSPPRPLLDRLLPWLVLALAVTIATVDYVRFLGVHRQLWYNGTHDRSSHYLFALRLTTDVRQGHFLDFLREIDSARVWPPLHGLIVSGVLLVGGLDYRLAVLPNLAGWVLMVLFGFLCARRAVPRAGNLAGLAAVFFLITSPAHRAYATDIMLESLGACLSLAVLYAYLCTVQAESHSVRAARWLGVALTLLFLQKYNYWLLVLLALVLNEVLARPAELAAAAVAQVRRIDWRAWLRSQLRAPLNYVLLAVLGLIAWACWRGPVPLTWGERSLNVYPPFNFIQIAWWVFFLRLWGWWRATGRAWADDLGPRIATLIRWHAWPVAVYMLLPRHVGYFLWFLSPANNPTHRRLDPLTGFTHYAPWFTSDYHLGAWSAIAVLVLIVVALISVRSLRRGGGALVCLACVALVMTCTHPNQKARFAHSWLPGAWVAAGAGLALLVHGRLTGPLSWRRPSSCLRLRGEGARQVAAGRRRWPRLRPILAAGCVAGMTLAAVPNVARTPHADEGGPHYDYPTLLTVTESLQAELDSSQRTAVLSAVAIQPLVQWWVLEHYGRLDRLEEVWFGFGPLGEPNREGFRHWLATTKTDTLVYLEHLPGKFDWEGVAATDLHAELRDLVLAQDVFHLVRRQYFPERACAVLIFQRQDQTARRE